MMMRTASSRLTRFYRLDFLPDELDWNTTIELTPPPQPGVTKFV